jgi:hypothetical protein
MKGLSIVIPVDENRLQLLYKTLDAYRKLLPWNTEFLIVTRTLTRNDFVQYAGILDIAVINYEWNEPTFSQTMALNLGIKHSKYDSIVVTSPEVMPITNVTQQLYELCGKNVVCQVFDTNEVGDMYMALVNSQFRSEHPGMHFLAMYNKCDLQFINGWDEDFMMGQAYDDDDFGWRFKAANLPYEFHDEICAQHLYHPRNPINELWLKDRERMLLHRANNIIQVKNGLYKLGEDNEDTSSYCLH